MLCLGRRILPTEGGCVKARIRKTANKAGTRTFAELPSHTRLPGFPEIAPDGDLLKPNGTKVADFREAKSADSLTGFTACLTMLE